MASSPQRPLNLAAGHRVDWRDEVCSTNKVAMQLADSGAPSGLWLVADRQTAGRGRAERSWVSNPGNLFASYLACFSTPAYNLDGLPLVAGLALYDAVDEIFDEASTAFPLALKWPNDLNCYGAKLGGILIETISATTDTNYPVIIGFGLNLKSAPDVPGKATTSLSAQGLDVSCAHALEVLSKWLDHWLRVWHLGQNMEAVCAAWSQRGVPLGARLKIRGRQGAPLEGRFAGLDSKGALLLDTGGEILTVTFGDVDILSEGDGDIKNGET